MMSVIVLRSVIRWVFFGSLYSEAHVALIALFWEQSVRFRSSRAEFVLQVFLETLPDDTRDKTEARVVEITSSVCARVPVLVCGIHGVILERLLLHILKDAHASVHVAFCVVSVGQRLASNALLHIP